MKGVVLKFRKHSFSCISKHLISNHVSELRVEGIEDLQVPKPTAHP